ncbi:MAG: hypothetical protein R3C11_05020 [Planctomycetaceae bacterium]
MNALGMLYLDGQGVPQNYSKALELFDKAQRNGSVAALDNLGAMYSPVTGSKKIILRRKEYWEAAAEK